MAAPAPAARSIYDLAKAVGDRFGEVAHPSELLRDPSFTGALDELRETSFADLTTYALGENATVASLALCAIGRSTHDDALTFVLDNINDLTNNTTKYFALHAVDRLKPAPTALLGRIFIALNDDWSGGYERLLTQSIRELARTRVQAGEHATFEGALEDAKGGRLDDVE
ncbi:MAG TPA: hypothetical protein VMU84_01135, partial [Thermoanaerobaculia bacterium]|nr:hypothetical protein [Thermoanaerobaculia bacterium]